MMTKILLLSLSLPFFSAQQEYHIKHVWVFSKTEYNGNVPRLPGGQHLKGVNKKLLCYIEVGKNQTIPQWQNANFNATSYSAKATPITQDSIIVGTDNKTKNAIVLKPASGDKIVQLELNLQLRDPVVVTDGFVLNGTFNNKAVCLKSSETVIELTPDMMP